ncbi:extensin-3-like [Arachis ipaensis]|uniref:extensin-3-like n=1 Tax=Arachis ipaensis TaxID=130454 RepID=UPI000A2AFCA7|nr:extensin-3-like [Arachis ipaensis]
MQGVVVEVTCEVGSKTIKAHYGTTKINGKYSMTVKDFDYVKYGSAECNAKLHAPLKDSPCNIPTLLNDGTHLFFKSEDKYEVVVKAKPFAYVSKKPYEECEKHSHHHNHKPSPTPYYNKSPPPPPSPTYVYKSPPPPAYYYKSPPPPSPTYVYKSPPPPAYYYKSPPPPSPTYVYKSPHLLLHTILLQISDESVTTIL